MRDATDPVAVFDALVDRDQIQIHPTNADRIAALAGDTAEALAAGNGSTMVLADTRDQVTQLNAATRERLVATGRVNDSTATTTDDGQRIGVGDRVTTRRNETNIDVANRDTWTINRVTHDGSLTVSGELGERILPAGYARQHVELAYAGTVHSMQGDTATTAHASIDEHSTAASV